VSVRGILILGVLTLVVLTLALLLVAPRGQDRSGDVQPLVPGLHEIVNEIDAIDITAADGSILASLRRDRERWRVRERSDYEADFELVHDLLRDLATGRRVDERTSNPDWYSRLGVVDMGEEGASGVKVSFPGRELPAIIVGHQDSQQQGQFVRLAGDDQTWLSDRVVNLPGSTVDFLVRAIMDIPASELAEVTLRHSDGNTVRLRSTLEDGGDDWVLLNVPDGRQAKSMWRLREVANALANLNLQDVRAHDSIPTDAVRALYVTRDGLNFVASLFRDEQGSWVHFSVSAESEAVTADNDEGEVSEIAIDAAAVDGRLSPWQFRISERKFETMTHRQEDLLEPQDD
jgi:hypothetical protein